MAKKASKRGKLIVIDGVDGSGKATQARMLVDRLRASGHQVEPIDFPRYYSNFFGKFIGECLAGAHGDFIHIDPYIASVLYAADRFESKKQIEEWLSKGKTVVADRYASANQMHQGGKIHDRKKAFAFLKWLDDMEFGVFGIPRPDLVVYLNVPVKLSMALALKAKKAGDKRYLKRRTDLSEVNVEYQESARKRALFIIKKNNAWKKIECVKRGEMRAREDIHEELVQTVSGELAIRL